MCESILCWGTAHAKRGMAERLEGAEGALMALARQDITVELVNAKLRLAQVGYAEEEMKARALSGPSTLPERQGKHKK